jgi:hypothetical protein
MKNQILFSLLILFLFSSCSKQMLREDEILRKRDVLESAEPNLLLSSVIQKSSYTYYGLSGVSTTSLAATMQYIQGNRSAGDNIYQGFEKPKGELYSLTAQIKLVQAAIDIVHEKKLKNYEGIFTIFKALLWSVATDIYGDIYYTEGLHGQDGILFPKFDEQKSIYPALIQDLKNASQLLSEGVDPIDKTYDLFYAGDKAKWIKFANSLRLRLLMRVSAKLSTAPADIAAVAALPLMTDTPDNASINYQGGDRTYSWPMGALYMGYTDNFLLNRPSKTLVDSLKALNDERLKVWVAPIEKPWTNVKADNGKKEVISQKGYNYDVTWEYMDKSNAQINNVYKLIQDSLTYHAGYPAGSFIDVLAANGSYVFPDTKWNYKISIFSKLLNENANPLLKACVLQADEVYFLLAEAAVRGYISGNPEDMYKKGVEMSLKRWGEPLPSTYFNNAKAKFPATGTNAQKLAKIGLQKWLGLFMMSAESYADYRRTRVPFIEKNAYLTTGGTGGYQFPLRFRYPETEMANNAINYQAAVAKLDKGDTEFSKMWLLQ